MKTSKLTLDDLRYRKLDEITAADGATWTPRVPREFVIRGTAYVVRVVDLFTGEAGTVYAELEAQAAHQCSTCPRSVRLEDLEERTPYACGPIPPEQLLDLPKPPPAPSSPEEDEERPSRLSRPERDRLADLWSREPRLSSAERAERDLFVARMLG